MLFLTLTGVGISHCLIQLTGKIQSQIHLDQLTGENALLLRATILTMEESELRLKIAKAALIAGCMNIVACPGLEKAYEVEKKTEETIQLAAKLYWKNQKMKWLSSSPHFGKNAFPELDSTRKKGEAIFEIRSQQLVSSARVWKRVEQNGWKVAWTN
jgi:hypothetical protein